MSRVTSCVRVAGLQGVNLGDVQSQTERQRAVGRHIRVTIGDAAVYGEITRVIDPGVDQTPDLRVFYVLSRGKRPFAFTWDFASAAGLSLEKMAA